MKPIINTTTLKKEPQWTTKISQPDENDILLGRGGSSIHNHANVRYRSMVKEFKKAYQTYTRLEKTQLAESLVQQWQAQDPPGRFLEKDDATGYWYIITEKAARRKTSQLLREGAPKIRRQLKDESDQQKQEQAQAQEQLKQQQQEEQEQTKQVFVFSNDTETLTRRAEKTPEAAAKKKKWISRRPSKVGRVRSVTPSSPLFKTTTPLKQISPAEINRAVTNIQEQQQNQQIPLHDETNPHSPPYSYPYYYYPYGQYQPWSYHHLHHAVPPSPVSVANSKFPPSPNFFTTPTTTTKTIPTSSSQEQDDHQDQENEPLPLHSNNNYNYHNDSDDGDDSGPTKRSMTSAPSPESVLEFELGTFQASWECTSDILDHCGDISALVDDMEDETEPASTFFNRPTITKQPNNHDTNQPLELPSPRLSPLPIHYHRDDDFVVEENKPGMMTGRTTSTASIKRAGDEPQPLLLDTWASFSFSSMDDAGMFLDSGDNTAISVFGGGESTIDILDDLDKELEAEMMLP